MAVRKRPGGLNIEIYKNYIDQELRYKKLNKCKKHVLRRRGHGKKQGSQVSQLLFLSES